MRDDTSANPDGTTGGTQLGRYELGMELGRGGMGTVYAAHDTHLGRDVALKVIAPHLARDPGFAARFIREMRIAATFEHPHVVPVYEAGEIDGTLFLAMRRVPGVSLEETIDAHGGLDYARVARIARQVGSALDAAHHRGLVHRDVKSANVLLSGSGDEEHAYLADFGLARATDSTSGVTQADSWIGTLDFIAPEILDGTGEASAKSDVYSMSCLLFHALAGEVPYPGPMPRKLAGHANEPLPWVSRDGSAIGPVDDALQRGAAKDPAARFASAGELARALEIAIAGTTGAAKASHRTATHVVPDPVATLAGPSTPGETMFDRVRPPSNATKNLAGRRHQRGTRIALIAATVSGLIVIGAVLAWAFTRDDGRVAAGPTTQVIERVTTVQAAPSEPTSTITETEQATTQTETIAPEVQGAGFQQGRYVQLGSFRTDVAAQRLADGLTDGGVDAMVIASDDAEELLPWFRVVVAGPVSSRQEGERLKRAATASGTGGGRLRPLTPAVSSIAPADLAGSFSGTLRQVSAESTSLNREIDVTLTFSRGGETGNVTYRRPRCRGSLLLEAANRTFVTFRESIDSGRCTDGGSWRVKPLGSGIGATWRHDEREYFVTGGLE